MTILDQIMQAIGIESDEPLEDIPEADQKPKIEDKKSSKREVVKNSFKDLKVIEDRLMSIDEQGVEAVAAQEKKDPQDIELEYNDLLKKYKELGGKTSNVPIPLGGSF